MQTLRVRPLQKRDVRFPRVRARADSTYADRSP
jgi:hypothetical protein